jgi:hypothetical protein
MRFFTPFPTMTFKIEKKLVENVLDRARQNVSGTQHFIVGTRSGTNRFDKNSNQ